MMAHVIDQEIDLIAFNRFSLNPHYDYGPRNNDRISMDTTLVDDSLEWVLNQLMGGNLPSMIERAGYPSIAAEVDTGLLATKVAELETTIQR